MLLSAILAAAVLIDGPVPESGNFRGEVAIEAFGSRGVMVYVDTNGDASFDHLFRLQVEDSREYGIDADVKVDHEAGAWNEPSTLASGMTFFNHASVEFAPGYMRVSSGTDALELFVEGTQSAQWNPDGARVWRRAGYALIHEVRESGIPIRPEGRKRSITADFCDASSDCDPGDTDGSGGTGAGGGGTTLCDAGGPGSTSCSVSSHGLSCTANCGTGYYSCCMYGSPNKCRCIRG